MLEDGRVVQHVPGALSWHPDLFVALPDVRIRCESCGRQLDRATLHESRCGCGCGETHAIVVTARGDGDMETPHPRFGSVHKHVVDNPNVLGPYTPEWVCRCGRRIRMNPYKGARQLLRARRAGSDVRI